MKPETMKRLMALPKERQDKIWQLAQERLKKEKTQPNKLTPPVKKTEK
jgi:hypothetical protein